MRSKVEKEFHADVKSYIQMVPCVTTYAMEKQVQDFYTLAQFKEFQKEIISKVNCDLVFLPCLRWKKISQLTGLNAGRLL